ncbi:hypothetical protein ACF1B0_21655 [Streptomyces anandii]|uniref:hypothetical protein n=1 Tax=Streptomyces anandii TaxID=285454 RepID=UPI0036F7A127
MAAAAAVVAMLAGFSALPTSAAHPGRSRDHGTSERYGDVIPDGSPTTVRADAAGE